MNRHATRHRVLATVIILIAVISGALIIMKAEMKTPHFTGQFRGDDHRVLYGQPYCGWYNIHGYRLGKGFNSSDINTNLVWDRENSVTTDLVEINISEFADGNISDSALSQLDSILSQYRSARHSVIIRILYDWDGKAALTEPRDLETVRRHISSIVPIINRYRDTVFVFQGVLLGNHGEMHGSSLLTDQAMKSLASDLRDAIDPSISLAVRTPAQLRYISGTSDPAATDGIGLFNDGLFGSDTDLGTYVTDADKDNQTGSMIKGTRSEENDYEASLGLLAPYGGEAGGFSSYSDMPRALDEIRRTHISYLSRDYSEQTIDKWKKSTVTIPGSTETADGITAIGMYLGARPEVTSVQIHRRRFLGRYLDIDISIRNTGSAPLYRPATATLSAGSEKLSSAIDTGELSSKGSTTLHFTTEYSHITADSVTLSVALTDDMSSRPILMSNGGANESGLTLGIMTR